MSLDCIITVSGHHSSEPRSSTTRPRHDQTRPVHQFFRGMSAYGPAVKNHILSCATCTPTAALPFVKSAPVCFGSRKVAKALLRNDPRTPRQEYLSILNPIHDATWAARFCSSEELWTVLQNVSLDSLGCIASHVAYYKANPDNRPLVRVDGVFKRTDWTPWMYCKPMSSKTSPLNQALVNVARSLTLMGVAVPSTPSEAFKLAPLAHIFTS